MKYVPGICSVQTNLDSADLSSQRRARIHELDMKHQSNVHQIDLVNKDEEARRLKLRVLTLRDDNATLKDSVTQKDARLAYLQRQMNDIRAELGESKQADKTHKQQLLKQNKEMADLRVSGTKDCPSRASSDELSG